MIMIVPTTAMATAAISIISEIEGVAQEESQIKFQLIIEVEDSIMPINKNEITKEMIEKPMQCETSEELIALAKTEGVELTKEEAEAYLAELDDFELDNSMLKNVAGGQDYSHCNGRCTQKL